MGVPFFCVWVLAFQYLQSSLAEANNRSNVHVSQYAVLLSNVGDVECDESRLEDFGRCYGDVVSTFYVRNYGRFLHKNTQVRTSPVACGRRVQLFVLLAAMDDVATHLHDLCSLPHCAAVCGRLLSGSTGFKLSMMPYCRYLLGGTKQQHGVHRTNEYTNFFPTTVATVLQTYGACSRVICMLIYVQIQRARDLLKELRYLKQETQHNVVDTGTGMALEGRFAKFPHSFYVLLYKRYLCGFRSLDATLEALEKQCDELAEEVEELSRQPDEATGSAVIVFNWVQDAANMLYDHNLRNLLANLFVPPSFGRAFNIATLGKYAKTPKMALTLSLIHI